MIITDYDDNNDDGGGGDDDDDDDNDDDDDDDDDDDRSGDPPPPTLASDACVGHLIHAQPALLTTLLTVHKLLRGNALCSNTSRCCCVIICNSLNHSPVRC